MRATLLLTLMADTMRALILLPCLLLSLLLGAASPPLLQTPPPVGSLPTADYEGKPAGLELLRGKVTAVVLSGQSNENEATAVSQDIVAALNAEPRFAFVALIDLAVVPSFAQGLTVGIIRDRLAQADAALAQRVTQSGQTFVPGLKLHLPDWSGQASLTWLQNSSLPEYVVFRQPNRGSRFERDRLDREQQKLRSQAQVFVVDRDLTVKAHYTGRQAAAQAIETIRGLLAAESTSPTAL